MKLSTRLDRAHRKARENIWMAWFAVFCRVALAAGFIPSGMQKVLGERFTVLSANHPMGNYLEAFYHTGYYYPFVGFMQVLAGILLLIPRTATLGALIYFPIILNICVLSLAVRFDGSHVSSPLMVCAVLYLLCWDYHKLKFALPFNSSLTESTLPEKNELNRRFPLKFFTAAFTVVILAIMHSTIVYKIMPRNTLKDCKTQCLGNDDIRCISFCECIHVNGRSLDDCLEEYNIEH